MNKLKLYAVFQLVLCSSVCYAKSCSNGDSQLKNETSLEYIVEKKLLNEMNSDFGWNHGETAQVVIALSLANDAFSCSKDIQASIIKKQLLLELTEVIIKWHKKPISAGKLSFFTNALLAICHNPSSFLDINLISHLKRKRVSSDFEDALVSFSICNAGYSLSKKSILRLGKLMNQNESLGSVDTAAMTMLAIACAQKYPRTYVQSVFDDALIKLKSREYSDGCFGNLHSNTLVAHALIASGENPESKQLSSVLDCIKEQFASGDYWNTFSYFSALPVLHLKSFMDLRTECICDECTELETRSNALSNEIWNVIAEDTAHSLEVNNTENTQDLISVIYSLSYPHLTDSEQNTNLSTVVFIEKGGTFLDVMKKASEHDRRFKFTMEQFSFGILVDSLGGFNNNDNGYWLLYQLSESSNEFKISNKDVEHIKPKEGEHFLFRYEIK